jgi:hypothetical protein
MAFAVTAAPQHGTPNEATDVWPTHCWQAYFRHDGMSTPVSPNVQKYPV